MTILQSEIPGYVETDKGLLIPSAYRRSPTAKNIMADYTANAEGGFIQGNRIVRSTQDGVFLEFDSETGIAYWPAYASGMDDYLMRALVTGYMANGSHTPVTVSMLSTLVSKRQAMAGTWTTMVRGKKSPVKAFLEVMSQADGSSYGPSEFVQNLIGALDVDNRGAIISQLPIGILPFDEWESHGLNAVPIPQKKKTKKVNDLFVLDVSVESFSANKGLWTIDGMTCFPTGNTEYPFWLRKASTQLKQNVWVLVHRDFGFQMVQHSGPKNNLYPGFGQSGTWRFSPYVVKFLAINRMDFEHMIAQPPRGIIWASGLDSPTQFVDQHLAFLNDKNDEGLKFYPGVFFGGSISKDSKITVVPWMEPPVGYTPASWTDEIISNLASSFHMNETHLRLKLGEGALTQSGVAESLEAETSISWMRMVIEAIWNRIAPPRVNVSVVWQSDRTIRYSIESFREFSLAVSRLQKQQSGGLGNEDSTPIFTNAEIRAMIEDTIGLRIPVEANETGIITEDQNETPGDISESFGSRFDLRNQQHYISLDRLNVPNSQKYAVGNKVLFADKSGVGVISGWSGNNDWVWVKQGVYEMLVSASKLVLIDQVIVTNNSPAPSKQSFDHNHDEITIPKTFRVGQKVKKIGGTANITITRCENRDGQWLVWGKYDWDSPSVDERLFSGNELMTQFQPTGDPLSLVDNWVIDREVAPLKAKSNWKIFDPDGYGDLFDFEWDQELRVWIVEDGSIVSQDGLVDARNDFAEQSAEVFGGKKDEEDGNESLILLLILGSITLAEWETAMRREIEATELAQFAAANGGFENLDDLDYQEIEQSLVTQFVYLSAFALAMSAGSMSEEEAIWRSQLYFHQSVSSFEEGRAAAWLMVLPAYPGDGSSECMMRDRCYWSIINMGDRLEARWIRTVAESCPTCISRSFCPPVTMMLDTGEQFNDECYF